MGHSIQYNSYKENTDKKKIERELNDDACYYSDSRSGLYNPIRWVDKVLDSYDDAHEYISEIDKGWYDQIAVKYRCPKEFSKKYKDLEKKVFEAQNKHSDLSRKIHYKGVKTQFVSCKNCGSKLSTKYISTNFCPMCRADLRPATTLEAIEKAKKKVNDLYGQLREEAKKQKSEIYWLVKTEYHV